MKTNIIIIFASFICLLLSGCGTLGSSATDVVLTGAGGYIGYEASGKKIGGAAIGAGAGYVASKIVQNEFTRELNEAEKHGYDRAMNQAVKQQYWIIQNRQKSDAAEAQAEQEAKMVTVQIPETTTSDGTILKPTTATIRTR